MDEWLKVNKVDTKNRAFVATLSIKLVDTGEIHIGSPYQFRFPISKKRRIRKKWSNNRNNWKYKYDRIGHKYSELE